MRAWINYTLLLMYPAILVATNDLAVLWMPVAFGCCRAMHIAYAVIFMPAIFETDERAARIQAKQHFTHQGRGCMSNIRFVGWRVWLAFIMPLTSTYSHLVDIIQRDPIIKGAYLKLALLHVQGVLVVVLDILRVAAACVAPSGQNALICAWIFLATFLLVLLVSCGLVVYFKYVRRPLPYVYTF